MIADDDQRDLCWQGKPLPNITSVHTLLIQLKYGDIEAIDILYPYYAREFYNYARRQGLKHEDAEDVKQMAFDRVLRGIEHYDEHKGSGDGWLRTICKRLVIDIVRRKSTVELLDAYLASEDTEPEYYYEHSERFRTVNRALERLPKED